MEARRGGPTTSTPIDPKMMADISIIVGRLVAKAEQLIGNFTTNIAEAWMHIRCKFDGGKVINRSQSGSFLHRSMGAGLRQNQGPTWGPKTWDAVVCAKHNELFEKASTENEKKVERDRKRKSTESEKENRRKRKYAKRNDNSLGARRAYSRHDDGEDVYDDVPAEILEEMKTTYYKAHVVLDNDKRHEIEMSTRNQNTSPLWHDERFKRITASRVGGIAKMRKTTKRGNKVREMLYTKFCGNADTAYGIVNEDVSRNEYVKHMQEKGHTGLTVSSSGLVISNLTPWLAASPDGVVVDPSSTPSDGLLELKNPRSVQDMSISDACKSKKGFCITKRNSNQHLDKNHDYYYQVQCQLYCTQKAWCDFVVRTKKDLYVERIHVDKTWWQAQLQKLQTSISRLFSQN